MIELLSRIQKFSEFKESQLKLLFFGDQTEEETACAASGVVQENSRLMPIIKAQGEVIVELLEALKHCRMFDTSGKMGEYRYGEIVNRRTPDIGKRFLTPKEASRDALKTAQEKLQSILGDNVASDAKGLVGDGT